MVGARESRLNIIKCHVKLNVNGHDGTEAYVSRSSAK